MKNTLWPPKFLLAIMFCPEMSRNQIPNTNTKYFIISNSQIIINKNENFKTLGRR